MKISRACIKNYRNLQNVDIHLESVVTLVGENNSGKSNFLRALTLPLSADESVVSKQLSWFDINSAAKQWYYDYIKANRTSIIEGKISVEDFILNIPEVSVTIELEPEVTAEYDVKSLSCELDGKLTSAIRYTYYVGKPEELLNRVKAILSSATDSNDIKMSLLPVELYTFSITVPGKDSKVPYETLSRFRYVTLPAERDSFSANADRLGSRALVDILQEKLSPSAQMKIEQEYTKFFSTIKEAGKLDEVLNWQDYSEIPNAKAFFDEIDILPNMPTMNSLFNSARLGYEEESLFMQGLGHRNLILMTVLLNSYVKKTDMSLRLVTVEEPEAHLCVSNILLMASFINKFSSINKFTQLVYSTHSSEFVNKVGLDKVVVLHNGSAISLKDELREDERDYLANNRNTDIFKILFSHRVIVVEGITEELLIKAY